LSTVANVPQEWDIYFDKTRPADYLCSLYRLQHRFRKGDHTVKSYLPPFDTPSFATPQMHPALRLTLHQTHLLLNPCWGTAFNVLEAVVAAGSIHIFLTPHWVYRAGCVLIQHMPDLWGGNLIQLYSNALVVLELSSGKWPSSSLLRDSLVDLMQHMKKKSRPYWDASGLTLGDVRL
jgi:hypothetical protein